MIINWSMDATVGQKLRFLITVVPAAVYETCGKVPPVTEQVIACSSLVVGPPLAVHVQVNVTLQRIFEAVVADINSTLVVPNAARCLEMFGGVSCVPQVLV